MNYLTLPSLSSDEYDNAVSSAKSRLAERIGTKPRRKDYQIDYASIFDIVSTLKLIVFLGAFVVSTLAMLDFVGQDVANNYKAPEAGISLALPVAATVNQVASFLLAESALLTFMLLANREMLKVAAKRNKVHLVLYLGLVILSGLFVFYVNYVHGLLIGYMVPFITIGLGIAIEPEIHELISRREETTNRYLEALRVYESSSVDITAHPDYKNLLYQAVWDNLVEKVFTKRNKVRSGMEAFEDIRNVDKSIRVQLVLREIDNRESWTLGQTFEDQINLYEEEEEVDNLNYPSVEKVLSQVGEYQNGHSKK